MSAQPDAQLLQHVGPSAQARGTKRCRRAKGIRKNAPRFLWSTELHHHFVRAYNALVASGEHASPAKIFRVMQQNGAPGVESLTNRQIQSHHQKYQLKLRNMAFKAAPETLSPTPFTSASLMNLPELGRLPVLSCSWSSSDDSESNSSDESGSVFPSSSPYEQGCFSSSPIGYEQLPLQDSSCEYASVQYPVNFDSTFASLLFDPELPLFPAMTF